MSRKAIKRLFNWKELISSSGVKKKGEIEGSNSFFFSLQYGRQKARVKIWVRSGLQRGLAPLGSGSRFAFDISRFGNDRPRLHGQGSDSGAGGLEDSRA